MVATNEACALCGLDIAGSPVSHVVGGEERHFCCQGCARVYEIAHEQNMLDQVLPRAVSPSPRLAEAILSPGETAYFSISGMWCAGCATAAEQVLRRQPGIKAVEVSFAAERGRIRYDPAQATPAALLRRLDALGYRSRLLSEAGKARAEQQRDHTFLQLIVAVVFGMPVMNLSVQMLYPMYATGQFDLPAVRQLQFQLWLLATPVLFIGGNSFLRGAWRALHARTATMDTLVALGTLSAYIYGAYVAVRGGAAVYFDSVAMITTFVMLGRYLELRGGAEARKGIRELLSLQPDTAWRRAGEAWEEAPSGALGLGDTILVKPGQRVPADAEIVDGQAALDEALLTGESAPIDKGPGDTVYAGTLATDSAVICRVTRRAQDTRLAHIIQLVDQTLAAKPPIQRLADRASAYFTFGILGVAVLTFAGWWSTGHGNAQGLLAAAAVLVVACPCALGLATPFAFTVTMSRAAQAGIWVRNPAAFESAADIGRVVFDKTGTLTSAQMRVVGTAVAPEASLSSEDLVCLAAAVEQYSEHPAARAIVAACTRPIPAAREFQSSRGLGASAQVAGAVDGRIMVGSRRFLGVHGDSALAAQAQTRAEQGQSIVWVGWGEGAAGFIALRDDLNPTAGESLRRLQADDIRPVMLSGDGPRTTGAVAAELRLAAYEGNCTPGDKRSRIEAWQAAGERVAMVGDGVNDAPALAQADLSITVAGGADVAGETSDVVLTRPDLTLVPRFIHLCQRTRRVVRQNLAWAFAYNLVVVPLAALGVISPIIAAAAMSASSVLVVGNSLRLYR